MAGGTHACEVKTSIIAHQTYFNLIMVLIHGSRRLPRSSASVSSRVLERDSSAAKSSWPSSSSSSPSELSKTDISTGEKLVPPPCRASRALAAAACWTQWVVRIRAWRGGRRLSHTTRTRTRGNAKDLDEGWERSDTARHTRPSEATNQSQAP